MRGEKFRKRKRHTILADKSYGLWGKEEAEERQSWTTGGAKRRAHKSECDSKVVH